MKTTYDIIRSRKKLWLPIIAVAALVYWLGMLFFESYYIPVSLPSLTRGVAQRTSDSDLIIPEGIKHLNGDKVEISGTLSKTIGNSEYPFIVHQTAQSDWPDIRHDVVIDGRAVVRAVRIEVRVPLRYGGQYRCLGERYFCR